MTACLAESLHEWNAKIPVHALRNLNDVHHSTPIDSDAIQRDGWVVGLLSFRPGSAKLPYCRLAIHYITGTGYSAYARPSISSISVSGVASDSPQKPAPSVSPRKDDSLEF